MPQKTSPFLEYKWGWNYGESGWNVGMDENLLKISFMFDSNIDGTVNSLPAAATGLAYYLTTDKRLYYSVENTWYSSPTPKWTPLYNKTNGDRYVFDGTNLITLPSDIDENESILDIQTNLSTLGTAAFEDKEYFATATDLENLSELLERKFNSVADLRNAVGNFEAENVETLSYYVQTSPNLYVGGSKYAWDSDSLLNDNGGTIIKPTSIGVGNPGRWIMIVEDIVSVKQFGAVGDGQTDDTNKIQACIDAHPGTHDITYTQNPPATGWKIYIPKGTYLIGAGATSRLNIGKNNVRIVGAGEGNTILKCNPSVQVEELIRFKEAYRCELSYITIDGGMPFTPAGNETYGANVGVVLDQVAYFTSRDLTSQYCRYSGINAIHLWESYFANLSTLGCGWFATVGRIGGGVLFTDLNKESTFFPGFESNQITFDKFSSNCPGTHLHFGVPVFNFKCSQVVLEGRTIGRSLQALYQPLIYITGLSNTIDITGYVYAHDQAYDYNAFVVDAANAGINCNLNLTVYNQLTNPSLYLQCPKLISTTSAYNLHVNIDVEDIGGSMTSLLSSGAESPVSGKILYRTDLLSKTLDPLFTSNSQNRFYGDIGFQAGDFSQNRIVWNCYGTRSNEYYSPPTGGTVFPVSKTVARVQFNGSTLAIAGSKGLRTTTPIVKESTGIWSVYFANPLPTGYTWAINAARVNTGDGTFIRAATSTYIQFENVSTAGTYSDSTLISVEVTI